MALHDTGELTCPRCGTALETAGEVRPNVDRSKARVPVDCPDCGAPLEVILTSAAPEAIGLDVWVEDRRSPD